MFQKKSSATTLENGLNKPITQVNMEVGFSPDVVISGSLNISKPAFRAHSSPNREKISRVLSQAFAHSTKISTHLMHSLTQAVRQEEVFRFPGFIQPTAPASSLKDQALFTTPGRVSVEEQSTHTWRQLHAFLQNHPHARYVSFPSLSRALPSSLLTWLVERAPMIDPAQLLRTCTIKDSRGEKIVLSGFEITLLIHTSPFFRAFWADHWVASPPLAPRQIPYHAETFRLLLQSVHDPLALSGNLRNLTTLADAADFLQLNWEGVEQQLTERISGDFEETNGRNVAKWLDIFEIQQRPLPPKAQNALQAWLNRDIGKTTLMKKVELLRSRFPSIATLDFSHTPLSDKELAYFSDFPLQRLNLACCPITATGLESLPRPSLQELDLSGCQNIDDHALLYLEEYGLRSLNLSNCCIQGAGLRVLPSTLTVLDLGYNPLNENELVHLSRFSLQCLSLAHHRLNDPQSQYCLTTKGIRYLENMPLKELDLSGNPIGDEGLVYLKKLPLRSLNLSFCAIQGHGLAYLTHSHLEELNLSRNPLTDEGLGYLPIPYLRRLNLSFCQIVGNGIIHLQHAPLEELDLSHNPVAEQGLAILEGLPFRYLGVLLSINDRSLMRLQKFSSNEAANMLSSERLSPRTHPPYQSLTASGRLTLQGMKARWVESSPLKSLLHLTWFSRHSDNE